MFMLLIVFYDVDVGIVTYEITNFVIMLCYVSVVRCNVQNVCFVYRNKHTLTHK